MSTGSNSHRFCLFWVSRTVKSCSEVLTLINIQDHVEAVPHIECNKRPGPVESGSGISASENSACNFNQNYKRQAPNPMEVNGPITARTCRFIGLRI